MSRSVLALLLTAFLTLPLFAHWEPARTEVFRDIVIPPGHQVEEATCFFCSIRVEGELRDGATAQWGDVEVSGVVDGDVVAVFGAVRVNRNAVVQGDSVSVFGDTTLGVNTEVKGDAVASIGKLQLSPGATVGKTSNQTPLPIVEYLSPRVRTIAVLWLTGMGISIVLGYACLFLLRKSRLDRLTDTMKTRRWRTVVLGIIVFGLLIAALQVGGDSEYAEWIELPLLIVLTALMGPGYTAMSLRLGERYARSSRVALLLGILVVVSVQLIPIAGWILASVLMTLSLGCLPASWALRLPAKATPAAE